MMMIELEKELASNNKFPFVQALMAGPFPGNNSSMSSADPQVWSYWLIN